MSWFAAGLLLGMVIGIIMAVTLDHRLKQQGCTPGDVLYPQSGGEPVDSSYTDPSIVGVMRQRTDKIDVLLVEDIKIQKRILELLKNSSPQLWMSKIPAGSMYDLWTVLVRLAEPDEK